MHQKKTCLYTWKKCQKFPLNLGGGHEGKLRTFDPLISALFRPAGAESEKVTSFCPKRIKNKNVKKNGQILKCKIREQGGRKVSFDLQLFVERFCVFAMGQYFWNVKSRLILQILQIGITLKNSEAKCDCRPSSHRACDCGLSCFVVVEIIGCLFKEMSDI